MSALVTAAIVSYIANAVYMAGLLLDMPRQNRINYLSGLLQKYANEQQLQALSANKASMTYSKFLNIMSKFGNNVSNTLKNAISEEDKKIREHNAKAEAIGSDIKKVSARLAKESKSYYQRLKDKVKSDANLFIKSLTGEAKPTDANFTTVSDIKKETGSKKTVPSKLTEFRL